MWILTRDAFLAFKMDKENDKNLLVRARVMGDIEKYWPQAKVECTPNSDYLCRASIYRATVCNGIGHYINRIDYTSYKGQVEPRRRPYHLELAAILQDMQEAFKQDETEESGIFQK